MHKTLALPLALVYLVLVVYASLYPFGGWRDQGVAAWAFLLAPLPRYWTWFDVGINLAGYVPLGFLLALGLPGRSPAGLWRALLISAGLSLSMETLQSFLPVRVASREDWLLNSTGALLGALLADRLRRSGAIERWLVLRRQWFAGSARGALVLLALWPLALLFPPVVPFGLGQVYERLYAELFQWFAGTPLLAWLPLPAGRWQPLSMSSEFLCVFVGLLAPSLLLTCASAAGRARLVMSIGLTLTGICAAGLSAALSWGPAHAWSWLDAPSRYAVLAVCLVLPWLRHTPARAGAALLLLLLGVQITLLNQGVVSSYFSQTLQAWEQGQFIRFHGLAQWLGWLWPYAVLGYLLLRAAEGDLK